MHVDKPSFPASGDLAHHVSHALNASLGFVRSSGDRPIYTPFSRVSLVMVTPEPMMQLLAIVTFSLTVEFGPSRQCGPTVTLPRIIVPEEIKQWSPITE